MISTSYIFGSKYGADLFADIFESRVIADGGTFESKSCLIIFLNTIL